MLPDAVYDQARQQFSEEELVKLTLCIAAINARNRIAINFRAVHPTHWKGWDLKIRPKGNGGCSAGLDSRVLIGREPGEDAARVRLGSYEFKKKGISRFDLRDPYHLAVALTWPQFLAALLALYLSVNAVFATLFWLVPGSVANARPDSFADALFFSIETLATAGYGEMGSRALRTAI
jgi:hypothetical protein